METVHRLAGRHEEEIRVVKDLGASVVAIRFRPNGPEIAAGLTLFNWKCRISSWRIEASSIFQPRRTDRLLVCFVHLVAQNKIALAGDVHKRVKKMVSGFRVDVGSPQFINLRQIRHINTNFQVSIRPTRSEEI